MRNNIRKMSLALTLLSGACVNETKTQPAVSAKPTTTTAPSNTTKPTTPSTADSAVTEITGPNARKLCQRPASIIKDPETIEDAVKLINALPKPVTVACFLDTLSPPLYVDATNNIFSGQPAGDAKSPRLFLFLGPSLIVSVVPTGAGAEMIEFSYRVNEIDSVKGELAFPVQTELALDAAYTHILNRSQDGTVCAACHFPENPAPAGFPSTAFVSRWVPAIEDYDVPLQDLQAINDECKTKVGDHCAIIQALFARGNGSVVSKDFKDQVFKP